MFGNVERLEIVVGRFDLRAFDDTEAEREKNALDLFVGLADEMVRADGPLDAGKREIDRRSSDQISHGQFCGFDCGFERAAQLIQPGADCLFVLGRSGLEPIFGDARANAVAAAEPFHAESFQRIGAANLRGLTVGKSAQFGEERRSVRGRGQV